MSSETPPAAVPTEEGTVDPTPANLVIETPAAHPTHPVDPPHAITDPVAHAAADAAADGADGGDDGIDDAPAAMTTTTNTTTNTTMTMTDPPGANPTSTAVAVADENEVVATLAAAAGNNMITNDSVEDAQDDVVADAVAGAMAAVAGDGDHVMIDQPGGVVDDDDVAAADHENHDGHQVKQEVDNSDSNNNNSNSNLTHIERFYKMLYGGTTEETIQWAKSSRHVSQEDWNKRVHILRNWETGCDGLDRQAFRAQNRAGYNWSRDFYVRSIDGEDQLLTKANDRMCIPIGQVFDAIKAIHDKAPKGEHKTYAEVSEKYCNISREQIKAYIQTNEVVRTPKGRRSYSRKDASGPALEAAVNAAYLDLTTSPVIVSVEDDPEAAASLQRHREAFEEQALRQFEAAKVKSTNKQLSPTEMKERIFVMKHWETGVDGMSVQNFRRKNMAGYVWMSKFRIHGECLALRETGKLYISTDQIFDAIYKSHYGQRHAGLHTTYAQLCSTYGNITRQLVSIFIKTCPVCAERKRGAGSSLASAPPAKKAKTDVVLPESHPIRAYLDDSSALVSCLLQEPDLLHCKELSFLREIVNEERLVSKSRVRAMVLLRGRSRARMLTHPSSSSSPSSSSPVVTTTTTGPDGTSTTTGTTTGIPRMIKSEEGDAEADAGAGIKVEDLFHYDVLIVGAGAAGIGLANALVHGGIDPSRLLIVEQGPSVGTSFRDWHKSTTFVSPSWPSYPFGPQDLNAIVPDTSLHAAQHPTGKQYAAYLEKLVPAGVTVRFNYRVSSIERGRRFVVQCEDEDVPLCASHVVWCGGEWSSPRLSPKDGSFAEGCTVHYKEVDIDETVASAGAGAAAAADGGGGGGVVVVVIGLGEAGAEVACDLAEKGVSVIVVDENGVDGDGDGTVAGDVVDPSRRLSPSAVSRMHRNRDKIEVRKGQRCVGVIGPSAEGEEEAEGGAGAGAGGSITVQLVDSKTSLSTSTVTTKAKVVMCTGFDVSRNSVIQDLFVWRDGFPVVSGSCDESTKTRNLFLSGPMLRHWPSSSVTSGDGTVCADGQRVDPIIFCFIYKFRTRFAVVAAEILTRVVHERHTTRSRRSRSSVVPNSTGHMILNAADEMQRVYKSKGMMLSDLSCDGLNCGEGETRSKMSCSNVAYSEAPSASMTEV